MSAKKKSPGMLSKLNCASGKSGRKSSMPMTMSPATPPDLSKSYQEDPEVDHEVITVSAIPGHGSEEKQQVSYTDVKVIGKGTFGVVYRAKLSDSGNMVAIKKVFHNEQYKNRELQMLRLFEHPNVIGLHYFFYSTKKGYKKEEKFLNMIMEFLPETLWSVAQCDGTNKPLLEAVYVKLYMYQLFRCLAYLHSKGICHRDVKPQNLLLNPITNVIKLCDFGSAKELLRGETNVAYICSRYYRAPELILGATDYTLQIDVWSAGCVLAELLLGQPIFPGATAADQLVEIIKVLGTPTPQDFSEINKNFQNFNFPHLRAQDWHKVLHKATTTPDAVDLVSRILQYTPSQRMPAIEVIAHQFFDELRDPHTRLKHGRRLPPLFNFLSEELEIRPDLNDRLVPYHIQQGGSEQYEQSANSTGFDDLDDQHDSRNETGGGRAGEHESSFGGIVGKFRSSLKKKISIKGVGGHTKTPTKRENKAEEEEEAQFDHNGELEPAEESPTKITEVEHQQEDQHETGEISVEPLTLDDTPDSGKKKKKKKKKRQRENVEETEEMFMESTPVKGAVEVTEVVTESPVVGVGDTEEVIVESYDQGEVTVESYEQEIGDGVTKVKKTKRKGHRKAAREAQNADESEVM